MPELSISILKQRLAICRLEKEWRAIKVNNPFDFLMTSVLVLLLNLLATAGISVFAISTYDTDYVLVKATNFSEAIRVLGKLCEIRD